MKAEEQKKQFNPAIDTMPQSMVVGKIPPGEGLWGAIERLKTCDSIRNGTLVVFSHEQSGRIGVFCNRYLTGAVIDSSGEKGLKSLKTLLALDTGMFCFRPCWGDEPSELGQRICVDIEDVLQVRKTRGLTTSTSDAIQAVSAKAKIDPKYEPGPEHSGETAEGDAGSATDSAGQEYSEAAISPSQEDGSKLQPGDEINAEPPQEGQSLADEPSEQKESSSDGLHLDYLDWSEKQKDESLNLRKILLPMMKPSVENTANKTQSERDLDTYRQILREEEDKVRQAIDATLSRGAPDSSQHQVVDDMQLLAGMLHSQEEMIGKRWQGLDDIPTPNAARHMDDSGDFKAGAPRRTTREFLSGCADLIEQKGKFTDPREFIKKVDRGEEAAHFWQSHPRAWIGVCAGGFVVVIVALAGYLNSSQVASCIKDGQQALKLNNWDAAAVVFSDALHKDPFNSKAHFYRGIALEEMGDDKRAQDDFKYAKSGIPSTDIAIATAGMQLKNENWQKAVDTCDDAITHGAKSLTIYRLRANANLHLGAFKDAVGDCDNALSLCKDEAIRAQILADRGFAKMHLQDYAGGAADFDAAIKIHPDQSLYMLKADSLRKAGRNAGAIATYNRVLDLDAKNYDAYVARGMCEANLHRKEEAIQDFGRALEINPNGVEALIQRGSLQLSSGAYRQAMDDLQSALDLNPTIAEAQQKLELAYAKDKGEQPKPLLLADTGSRVKLPSDPRQLVIIGYNEINKGDLDGAIECLVQAVKKQPNNVNARRYLAYAFVRAGSFNEAVQQFKALSGLQILSNEDILNYADALEGAGNSKGAADLLAPCVSANESDVQMRSRLARVYYRAGQEAAGDQIILDGLAHANSEGDKQQLLRMLKRQPAQPLQQVPTGGASGPG